MAYLILSDIHGNLEALHAVLASAKGLYGSVLCLGDLVGYGADPNAIVDWTRHGVQRIVRGNHDKACAGVDALEDYNAAARKSAEWTRTVLTPENVAYLADLPRGPVSCDDAAPGNDGAVFDLVHGSPLDEDEYLVMPTDVWPLRSALTTHLTFFGHTHIQGGFLVARGGVKRIRAEGTLTLERDHYYLVNPGSVGQPRDGDRRAAYAIYSPEDHTVEYRRAEYDVDAAARKIRAAGLPESLALRLYEGL